MGFVSILGYAQQLIKERIQLGDYAIDATMGNGVDTLFLSQCVGPKGIVHAFDIQAEALENTKQRLLKAYGTFDHAKLHLVSHAEMERAIPIDQHSKFKAVMFNFGYLPGVESSIITKTATSIQALEAALRLLKSKGLITAVLYPGHAGGHEEAEAIEQWAASLPQIECRVLCYRFMNSATHPPYLLAIEKG
jgi:ubiquinone/menaquinone biosynthesis C-methylase UbiE